MSIATEIARISGNISDSLTAVANKGVTVPAGSNSDDLAGLIALISTGGGGGGVEITQDQDGYLVLDPDGSGGPTLVTKTITQNGTYSPASDNADGYSAVTVNVPTPAPTLQAKTNISPSTSSQTITADSGYDGLSSVQINAMPSGTAGTPTATKGSVSNHQVSVTPSVTNTTGYITGSTKTGAAVTVSASELVSGSETKTANGTYDVTNLAELVVNVSSGGSVNIDTKTVTATNYPLSISFSSMKGQPKAWFLKSTAQISSSGSTTYYYIINMLYNGTDIAGSCFHIGSTRRVEPVTSGYSASYSGTTLTITSSASSRSYSPGAFNNTYELVYIY